MSKYLVLIALSTILNSCTVNLLQTDTHGTASDVVDETDSVRATANIPVSAIPSIAPLIPKTP